MLIVMYSNVLFAIVVILAQMSSLKSQSTSLISTISSLPPPSPPPPPAIPTLNDNKHTFKLVESQCQDIETVFRYSKMKYAYYIDSCDVRFLKIQETFDGYLLLFISMKEWVINGWSSTLFYCCTIFFLIKKNISFIPEHEISLSIEGLFEKLHFNFKLARLIIRVEKFLSDEQEEVPVTIWPSPTEATNGILSMKVKNFSEMLLFDQNLENSVAATISETNCSIANSYMVLCAYNKMVSCPIEISKTNNYGLICNCPQSKNNNILIGFIVVILIFDVYIGMP